jgi:DNA-binding MurR/RpiR family transcriptional regulator
LKEAGKKGAKTVLITAKSAGDEENLCDERLLIASRKYLDHGNVISPQFPILVMMDLIYSYYIEHDKEKKEEIHEQTIKALEEKKHENY